MPETFLNPITLSFALLEGYRELLAENLARAGLVEDEIHKVCSSLEMDQGLFLSINRPYQEGRTSFRQFCRDIGLADAIVDMFSQISRLHAHQEKGIQAILAGRTTIVSTGTGSGKTETFLIPLLDHCLKHTGPGVKALILYPMNALANDQVDRLKKAIAAAPGCELRYALFTGDTSGEERDKIRLNPPDILITNYVMLDWMLTRPEDRSIFKRSLKSLRFLVLDEIHTYRGNRATHLKYLLARLKVLLDGPLVQVGTSATLRSQGHEGYLQGAGADKLDRFIYQLLDAADYAFIEPEYKPEPESVAISPLPYVPANPQHLGWSLNVDNAAGLANLTNLTGRRYSQADLFREEKEFLKSPIYQDIARSPFVLALRQALIEQGAQSLTGLVSLLTRLLPDPALAEHAVEVTKAYLSAIMFLNHLVGDHPVLDLRVHLFLRDTGGFLKRCVRCRKYHSGRQELCQDCGFPLFYVCKEDINRCIGKVSGGRLKSELRQESDDRKNAFYVLIDQENDGRSGEALTFQEIPRAREEELILDYAEYGRLKLTLFPAIDDEEVLAHVIPLSDERKDYQYLYGLVTRLLSYQKPDQRKLLGFIDNREKATQYGIVLQDEFANDFFEAFLRLYYPTGHEVDLKTTLEILRRQIPEEHALSSLEKDLFQDMELWYCRAIGYSPRKFPLATERIQLKSFPDLTPFERELLEIFLNERAIALRCNNAPADSKFIRFWRYLATDRVGIYLNESEKSILPSYPGISLGEQGQEYREFIQKYGSAMIKTAVEGLVQREILIREQTKDGKTLYYLSPRAAYFQLPPSKYSDYRELKRELLRTAAVHSSEVKSEERRRVEEAFHENEISFLSATPTLELGIDIGQLQMVLMVGVPPMPSNYAQRAGRAGRSAKNKYALIVTFCFENNAHDSHYFSNPKQMIDGVISPPVFNQENQPVIEKHINALMLAEHSYSQQQFRRFTNEIDRQVTLALPEVERVFPEVKDIAIAYLRSGFQKNVLEMAQAAIQPKSNSLQQFFYSSGFFSDHAFPRDQVLVLDRKHARAIHQAVEGATPPRNDQLLSDLALSARDPEQAFRLLVPGQKVFMAGDLYQINEQGKFGHLPLASPVPTRSYSIFLAEKEQWFAAKDRIRQKYLYSTTFSFSGQYQEKGRVLGVAYEPNCKLSFLNCGLKKQDGVQPFSGEEGDFQLGYQFQRQAFILRFNREVCFQDTHRVSLAAALNRAMIDGYGLDESEVRLAADALPEDLETDAKKFAYIVFYDASGNGSIPFQRIYAEFDQLVALAYQKLTECPGSPGQPCMKGCYACLRSYYTQATIANTDKEVAMMFLGYLLGKNAFVPSIEPFEAPPTTFDLHLRIKRQGNRWLVRSHRQEYAVEITTDQNQAVFDLLVQAVQAEFTAEMKALRITTGESYLIDAINQGRIQTSRAAFARLQFHLLRFKHILAEKGG